MSDPCIIEVALNGVVKKDVNPQVPRSPAEIVADALGCIDAGATIVHNHNDEYLWAEGGVHSAAPYIEAWGPILDHTGRDIAKYLGVSRATLYRYLVHEDGAGRSRQMLGHQFSCSSPRGSAA
jgi:hypothetical protein